MKEDIMKFIAEERKTIGEAINQVLQEKGDSIEKFYNASSVDKLLENLLQQEAKREIPSITIEPQNKILVCLSSRGANYINNNLILRNYFTGNREYQFTEAEIIEMTLENFMLNFRSKRDEIPFYYYIQTVEKKPI